MKRGVFKTVQSSTDSPHKTRRATAASMVKVDFEKRHLTSADPEPRVDPDRLTVFNFRYCPFATRVMLVATAKDLDYDLVNVDTMDKPVWYKPGKHPLGQVPVVQLGDFKGVESLVLADYLEEKYPQPRLGPRRPEDKVEEANLVAEFHRRVTSAWWKTFSALDPEAKSSSASLLEEGLAWMEGELEGRGYFARDAPEGGRPGLVDYKMWPWFPQMERLPESVNVNVDWAKYKNLSAWISRMRKDPAVEAYTNSVSKEDWVKYLGKLRRHYVTKD